MKVLLIWEEIPEYTRYMELDPATQPELVECARKAAGYYINAEDNEAVNTLNEMIYGPDGIRHAELYEAGKEPIVGPFSEVIVCGFVM